MFIVCISSGKESLFQILKGAGCQRIVKSLVRKGVGGFSLNGWLLDGRSATNLTHTRIPLDGNLYCNHMD